MEKNLLDDIFVFLVVNDDIDGMEVILYLECMKLKWFIYYGYFYVS